ncbi:MAG: DNA cytosine methyltransferase [Lentisphaeria bacterium]|nr:DNA cytosine methyltransferase [Lentisphaeria bacterium]
MFVVGYFGDWVRAAQVILEPNRMSWNTPSRFKARESIAGFTGQDFALASGELCNSATDSGELLEQSGVKGFDCYNQNLTDDVSMTVTSKRADPHHVPCAVQALRMRAGKDGGGKGALIQTELSGTLQTGNDQAVFSTVCSIGNGQVDGLVNEPELAQTLNCMHDQQAIICCNSKKMGLDIGYDLCNTLNATDYKEPQIVCYENHANDSRVKDMGESCQTLNSRMGTGGGNLPLVQEYYNWHSQNVRADKIEDDCSPTIPVAMGMGGASMTTPMFINECYAIDSLSSNSMKSSNPHSGFHKEDIAKTLDTTNQDATKNQGGNVIVDAVAIAENVIGRAVENGGNGVGAQEELAYTQNATGVMGVCNSTVRRLIPVECERLMGFPDNHTRIAWNGKSPEDCPDAPRYKACGNSMCVNVMRWIGMRIDRVDKMESSDEQ